MHIISGFSEGRVAKDQTQPKPKYPPKIRVSMFRI